MKKTAILFFALLLTIGATAQKATTKAIKQVMTLKIDRPGGANAASIAWHPVQKKYYAAMAGNETFPMEVFDAKGKMVSSDDQETKFDVRGFWYNTKTKTLQANGYDDLGWVEYKLNAKGMPESVKKLDLLATKPDAQSVGAYNPKKDVVYMYNMSAGTLEPHSLKDGAIGTDIELHLGAASKKDMPEDGKEDVKYNYNENAIIYTGIAKAEIGLLNTKTNQVELYDLATGYMTQILKLPEGAPVNGSLNFSFSNGIYWLFDKTERIWHGYR
jgi:hypothetical protein